MDTKEIQTRLDAMPSAMAAKGKKMPHAEYRVEADSEPNIVLSWSKNNESWRGQFNYIKGQTPAEIIENAIQFIAALPTAEETRMKEFMTALSDVIELGRKSGVEVDFVNPLVETMKRLSSNIITDQRVAA